MSSHLIVAPAASGKTACVLALARQAAEGLRETPMVVVASRLQERAWKRRLAEAGGAIGVRVLTFDGLYAECLSPAGAAYTELSEPVQYRLLRTVVDGLALAHYAPLVTKPGFLQLLRGLIAELKSARIGPEAFAHAVEGLGAEPRLQELAQVYSAYQARIQAEGWADPVRLGWLAVEVVEARAPDAGRPWCLLIVDGFDDLTVVQLALLRSLAGRVGKLVVALTGIADGSHRPLVHQRSERTRTRLRDEFGQDLQDLRDSQDSRDLESRDVREAAGEAQGGQPALRGLEERLFRGTGEPEEASAAIELVEAPDRAGEAREALRWLKARIVLDGVPPGELALLARDIAPYRAFILQTAAEFGLPVRILGGLPLRANPAVAALLDLLRLVLPRAADNPEPSLPRRRVVEAWRSPYFDWQVLPEAQGETPAAGLAADADALDAAARWGLVIGGLGQWREVLDRLASRAAAGDVLDEEQATPAGVPVGAAAAALRDRFERFVRRLTPPPGPAPLRTYVGWIEDLIGPGLEGEAQPQRPEPHMGMVSRAREGSAELRERDTAALRAVKDVLRGLVWAEEALGSGKGVAFPRFYEEVAGAVDAATYHLPAQPGRDEIVVANVFQARGVGFRAVAVLGLAEGEFPTRVHEDPFLRDADRKRLREEFGLDLDPSTESAEAELFYQAVARPRERLLLTRPRLAEGGALWQASPFWEEVRRQVHVEPARLTSESLPSPSEAASWPELMEGLASGAGDGALRAWAGRQEPERSSALEAAVEVLRMRERQAGGGPFDGDLREMADALAQRFGPDHVWSPSRLEGFRACPFLFFVGTVLGLEPRGEPEEGLNVAQRGTLYHRILERVYQDSRVRDPLDVEQLLAVLPEVAGAILDAAPEEEGFRETAWWAQTRREIVAELERTLPALAQQPGDFLPCRFEARFGLGSEPPLRVIAGGKSFFLHGVIDRIDRSAAGQLRVIDYKSGGPTPYSNRAVMEGKKLQLPLYALAARDALRLGEPTDGFYWHVRHAVPSTFRLGGGDGPEAAMQNAAQKAWEAVQGARAGQFVPHPPDDGCPAWCGASGFCWHYHPRFGG